MFVHLTPAVNEARVRRAGIKAVGRGGRGGGGRGVFCFPVLPSYTLTHQWLRELARREGPRGLVAVHGRLPDDERVSVGPYHGTPVELTASDAVRRVAALADPRGVGGVPSARRLPAGGAPRPGGPAGDRMALLPRRAWRHPVHV